MRRIRALRSHRPDSPDGSSLRPSDGSGIFVIANNIPILVNRIQVRSAVGDEEPSQCEPSPPQSGHLRRNELPLVDGLHQPNTDNVQGNSLRPTDVQIKITNGRDSPIDSQLEDGQPVQLSQCIIDNGGDEQSQNDEPGNNQVRNNDGHREDDQSIRRQRSPPFVIERLDDDEIGEQTDQEAGDIQQQPDQGDREGSMPLAKLYSIPTYMKTHFDIMFYMGISPINGNGERGSRLQMVAFSMVTIISMLFAFARCKLNIIDQMESGSLQNYITAWHYISALLLQLGFLWLVVLGYDRISAVLQDTTKDKPGIRYKPNKRKISLLTVTFACLALTAAGVEASKLDLVVDGLFENVEHILLSHSHATGMLMFLWNKETNGTENYLDLFAQYGQELTAVTVPMGIFGMIMTFIGLLQAIAIKDILLMASLHTLRMSKIFHSNMVHMFHENQASDELTSSFRLNQIQFAEMTNDIESCFGNFFKLVHADYLLYCASFLAYLINSKINAVYIFEGGLAFLKIACILHVSTAAIEKSQAVKAVIRMKYSDNDCPNDVNLKKVMLLLQTLEESPIALGRGNFMVDETFALKFVGAVVTFFLFFMESYKDN